MLKREIGVPVQVPLTVSHSDSVLDRVSDGFVALDKDFNYTYVNASAGKLLGRQPADLIGKNYWQEYPKAKNTPFPTAYSRAMDTQENIILEDYYEFWDRWFVNRIYPSKDGITIFFSDITDQKLAGKIKLDTSLKGTNYILEFGLIDSTTSNHHE